MSNVPGVAPFSATKSLLEIGQFNKTNADRRAINAETNNFLEMKRSRQAKEKAANALSVQESGMQQDVNKDRIAEDRHRTGARAADKAAEAKSKADEVGSESDMAFDILSDINSEEDHTRAYFRMQGMDVPHDEIIGVIGETYEPGQIAGNLDAIKYRREDQGKLAEVAAKDRATVANSRAARMDAAVRLAVSQNDLKGRMMSARTALKDPNTPLTLESSPIKSGADFAAVIAMQPDAADWDDAEIKLRGDVANAHYQMKLAKVLDQVNQWKAANQGVPVPEALYPRYDRLYEQALIESNNAPSVNPRRAEMDERTGRIYDTAAEQLGKAGSPADREWSKEQYRHLSPEQMIDVLMDMYRLRDAQNVTK